MGIDTPLQIEVLIAFGVFTAAVITAFVRYLLKSKSLPNLNPDDHLKLIVLLLFFFTIAAVISFLFFNAVAYGVAYGIGPRDRGKAYFVSRGSVPYWILVVMYYSAAVAALSFGLVMAAKLIQPRRPLSKADLMKKALERVGESAGASSDSALDAESEMSDSPTKPFTRLWIIATSGYTAVLIIASIVYSSGDWDWDMPPSLPLAALAPIFVSLGGLAIYTGEVRLKGSTFYRSRNPFVFWVCVAVVLSMGIFMFLAGIGVIGQ